jgi:hypothetical protein
MPAWSQPRPTTCLGCSPPGWPPGQTGSIWQRRLLATLEPRLGRERALAAMLQRYLEYAATDQPVHTWPTNP